MRTLPLALFCLITVFLTAACGFGGDDGGDDGGGGEGQGTFYGVGEQGTLTVSTDRGRTWSDRQLLGNGNLQTIEHTGSRFLIAGLGFQGRGTSAWYSDDAENWLESYPTVRIETSAYGNGTWVVLSASDLQTSTDGITWSAASQPFGGDFITDVDFAYGIFLAVGIIGGSNLGVAYVSTDAVTWSRYETGQDFGTGHAVIGHGNGVFVVGFRDGSLHTTTDGVTWSPDRGQNVGADFKAIAYGNGTFVAAGNAGKIWISTDDGASWTQTSPNEALSFESGTFGDGTFVLSGRDGDVWRSETGELGSWTMTEAVVNTSSSISIMDLLYLPD